MILPVRHHTLFYDIYFVFAIITSISFERSQLPMVSSEIPQTNSSPPTDSAFVTTDVIFKGRLCFPPLPTESIDAYSPGLVWPSPSMANGYTIADTRSFASWALEHTPPTRVAAGQRLTLRTSPFAAHYTSQIFDLIFSITGTLEKRWAVKDKKAENSSNDSELSILLSAPENGIL